jgi:SET domain-containing protein 6
MGPADKLPRPVALIEFEAWMRSAGIWWNTDLVVLHGGAVGCSGAAFGVSAVAPLEERALLCRIPHSAILSVRTTGFSGAIKKHKLGGGLGLIAAVLYELGLGEESRW